MLTSLSQGKCQLCFNFQESSLTFVDFLDLDNIAPETAFKLVNTSSMITNTFTNEINIITKILILLGNKRHTETRGHPLNHYQQRFNVDNVEDHRQWIPLSDGKTHFYWDSQEI